MQGVGFRPMIYGYAIKNNIVGTVCNGNDGLHIEFNASSNAEDMAKEILANAPSLSFITEYNLTEIKFKEFTAFNIIESDASTETNLPLTPDFAMCGHCKTELEDVRNRRYNYPFITCTQCGPRYSIAQSLPYDRCNTSMQPFEMCGECKNEYGNITDRRFYSQTNSCAKCGIQLSVFDANKNLVTNITEKVIAKINDYLNEGKIVAVKGIGGFLLLCDAANKEALTNLRNRKRRPTKPFAVLCKNMEQVETIVQCSEREAKELQSVVAPIVLVKQNREVKSNIAAELIAPGLANIGVMLPYAPLLQIIANNFNKPLVATSANISGSPIIYTDEAALDNLCSIADFIVTHNREIVLPQDDSVVQFANNGEKIILRRARGMAPSYFESKLNLTKTILATGALMKSSFASVHNANTYVSQYLGSTDGFDAQETFKQSVEHFIKLTKATPNTIITDKHSGYFTTTLGNELAKRWNTKVYAVQHHKAHFAAVLSENNLIHHAEPILGVIWDGTGLGDDGNIWGGEFFSYRNNTMLRCYYFDYFPILLKDKMANEPRLSALAICYDIMGAETILQDKFSADEWKLYNAMLQQTAAIETSSVGRIFDALASLLNLCNKQTYEGEAALYLQNLATTYFEKSNFIFAESYFTTGGHYYRIPTKTLFAGIILDIVKGKPKEYIAAKFHYSLVHIIQIVANNIGVHKICVSGGVFQNSLLVTLLQHHLGKEYALYFHKQLSPNDENVSYGQMAYWLNDIDMAELANSEQDVQVSDTTKAAQSDAVGNKTINQQKKQNICV